MNCKKKIIATVDMLVSDVRIGFQEIKLDPPVDLKAGETYEFRSNDKTNKIEVLHIKAGQ